MAEEKSTKTKGAFIGRSPEAAGEQAARRWREDLTRFFDENDVGLDALWLGKDLDDFDYCYLMSGYEVYSLFPGLPEAGVSVMMDASLTRFLRSEEGLVSFAHLYGGSGSFRYALPHESDLA
ncbi:MAG TPA: hypothetical protein P5244_02010 [Syntrophales bacterium]|nr:hypothetical protein [Syntrophobacterales bacterium]HRR39985.1 hypothetical protein [Syntrophales bacterium]HRT27466.1 hypothetical protein [Syntrophales bacterium]HRT70296.1 hypothetical protein [Syntrophales bacterium]